MRRWRPGDSAAVFNGGGGRLGAVPLEHRGEQWAAVACSGDGGSWAVARTVMRRLGQVATGGAVRASTG